MLADSGSAELINIAVQLTSQLGSALERIATEQGLAAADLAEGLVMHAAAASPRRKAAR
ncbi:hypothetical protein [Pseudonocardia sp. NPDC049154]|uniref:hypothetical protein n=1 Tax=Pseudonocardia sp. NPDC049154 TaxID=3155501 RepID=UPI0033CF5139